MVAAVQRQEAVDHHLGRPAVRTNDRKLDCPVVVVHRQR